MGQKIAEAGGFVSVPVYSGVSGKVTKIKEYLNHDGRKVPAIVIDTDGLHVGDNQSGGEVLIDSESVNVVMGGQKYSRFAANYVQFGLYQLRQSADGGLVFKL